ncbi:hypothetical protein BDZ89DRAFT_1230388 [Hymenopellis radicata]|nr:hypothetical protein BDZ89DRAFT_1230388 [Hymenopellis radicata]
MHVMTTADGKMDLTKFAHTSRINLTAGLQSPAQGRPDSTQAGCQTVSAVDVDRCCYMGKIQMSSRLVRLGKRPTPSRESVDVCSMTSWSSGGVGGGECCCGIEPEDEGVKNPPNGKIVHGNRYRSTSSSSSSPSSLCSILVYKKTIRREARLGVQTPRKMAVVEKHQKARSRQAAASENPKKNGNAKGSKEIKTEEAEHVVVNENVHGFHLGHGFRRRRQRLGTA